MGSVQWDGDVLDRKPIGDFLYKLVMQKYQAHHTGAGSGALCFALDADWGAGKTFFVSRWSKDVVNLEHPVVMFDAWSNDLADDPLVGFMATLRAELNPWQEKLPVAANRATAAHKLAEMMRQARSAVMPAAAVVGKGLLKKFTGVAVDEVVECVVENQSSESQSNNETLDAGKLSEASLDRFFDVALKAHSDRREAIIALKAALGDLLCFLNNQAAARLPLFVFIDELDRCRPDYAIRLLEGIKHLFDAPGVCFVVSTNLAQLSASARAVYGTGFDAHRYLKRFFSFEYLLPPPDHKAYAVLLVEQSAIKTRFNRVLSAFQTDQGEKSVPEILALNFSYVAKAFDLDLRSQQQVFRQAEAATSGLPESSQLYCFYLFMLAAALHRGTAATFDKLISAADSRQSLSADLIGGCGLKDVQIHFLIWDPHSRHKTERTTSVAELFFIYHDAAFKSFSTLHKNSNRSNNYPETLVNVVANEANGRPISDADLTSLSLYGKLVRAAGQLR